ncbi:MAG: acyclic terpene utilization AtuA family protein [Carbonactinosporaceae bacterium]
MTAAATTDTATLRIANCSGFFGDRITAAHEMVEGGPVDVLTGDWLAELTMGVLAKQRSRPTGQGYPFTFLLQMRQVLAACLERGVKIVTNAGGLDPEGCARAVEELAGDLGLTVRVARVAGDGVTDAFLRHRERGWAAPHLDTGEPFDALDAAPEVVNAYLGCWGIVEALDAGADVVVTGRVSDASVVVGPAAWHFGWQRADWDALAGAVAAGHVIECGAQATGGNFSFFTEVPGMDRPGFPLAEISRDGSAVITKHPGTGGAVTVETVTAQLLYEIDGPRYVNPDVVARFDTLRLRQEGTDRVRLSGSTGEPAPELLKVGAVCPAGWRNAMTFVLTGLDIEAKAELAQQALWGLVPGGREAFDAVEVRLLRADRPDPACTEEAVALLTVAVAARDEALAGRLFSGSVVGTGLASYPGFYCTEPPGRASAYSVFWPTLLPRDDVREEVVIGDRRWPVAPPPSRRVAARPGAPPEGLTTGPPERLERQRSEPTVRVPLGRVIGTRSGDKAGNATLGCWARDPASYAWLASWLTEDRLRALVPEIGDRELRRFELANLHAVGFTIVGLLGRGVAANLALDGQAKGLGEYVRAKLADVPADLVNRAPQPVRSRRVR